MYLHQIRWLIQPTTAQYNTPKYVKKHINIIHFDSVAPQKYDDTALIINHDCGCNSNQPTNQLIMIMIQQQRRRGKIYRHKNICLVLCR